MIPWNEITDALKQVYKDNFICHYSITEWGGSVMVMEKSGRAFSRTYYFKNDPAIFFEWLSVNEDCRGMGIASKLLDGHINIAKLYSLESFLYVKKGTWVKKWYEKKGYRYHKDFEDDIAYAWMYLKIS